MLLTACAPEQPSAAASTIGAMRGGAEPPAAAHSVTVWATDSMRRPLTQIARRYEQDAPGSKVELFFAGGAELLDRRNADGACDLLVIGDSSQMSRFAAAVHLATHSPTELARSRIAIVTAAGNPLGIQGLRDFARTDLRLVFGTRSSSIGRYTRWALSRVGVEVAPALERPTAAAVLAAVRAGQADAGVVYVTSFADEPASVARVDVPEADNQPVLYSISVDRLAREPAGAAAFRALALSPVGQGILRDCGFLPIGSK
jgi:molybdate transport system substrate-binding protein